MYIDKLEFIRFIGLSKEVEKKENENKTIVESETESKHPSIEAEAIDAANLKQTVVMPHIEAEIPEGKSVIYCSTFQLAWNELINNVIEKDVEVENGPITGQII